MLTILEVLIIVPIIPVLVWALLPVQRTPRFLDFLAPASVFFLILHLLIDNEPVRLRFIPLYIFTSIFFLTNIVRVFRHNPSQPKRRVLAGVGRVFSLLLLTLCIVFPTIVLPFLSLPEPTGQYDVGTMTCVLADKNRAESYSDEEGAFREIPVQFWYPTQRTGSKVSYDIQGAPVAATEPNYPMLVFSHGAFGVRMSNASTFRELASHGYIVASIDHTYQAFYTAFPDGRNVLVDQDFLREAQQATEGALSTQETFQVTHAWLDVRTADIELVLDSLKSGELGPEAEILNGNIDFSKIGLFGHSLGGAASAQVCRERDDVTAAIILDGTMIGDIIGLDGNTEVLSSESYTKPLMQMYNALFLEPGGKEDSYLPNIRAYENASAAVYSLCIKDSGHLNFTDLPRISPFLSRLLGVGSVDAYDSIDIVNAYTLAFFDRHLKGQSSPLLEGTAGYDEVIFESRIPAAAEE